jgi:hypothetical protein
LELSAFGELTFNPRIVLEKTVADTLQLTTRISATINFIMVMGLLRRKKLATPLGCLKKIISLHR